MTDKAQPRMDLISVLMLLLLAAVWGGSFFFTEVALREVPPLTITLHRIFWAVPVLALVVRLKGIAVPRSAKIWGAYLVMGALNNVIPFSLIIWGQTRMTGGLASVLNGSTAIFGAVIAGVFLADERLNTKKTAGAILGVAGVAVIMGPDAVLGFNPANLAQLAVLGAAVSYGLASVWGKLTLKSQPPLMNALGMLTGSTILILPVALMSDGIPQTALSGPVFGALLGVATLSTALAYCLYFAILIRAGAANLMLVTLLIPPFAIIPGMLFLGERPGAEVWAGFAIISLGIAVTDGRLVASLQRILRAGVGRFQA